MKSWPALAVAAAAIGILGCGTAPGHPVSDPALPTAEPAFLDTLEERTFRYFWDLGDPETGLIPDRAPTRSFMSTSAVGFALTAYPIGVERGYVSRGDAAERTLRTLRWLWTAPQGAGAADCAGYRGFFYHFLDAETGLRYADVELSTMDTALLLAGALFSGAYFDRADPAETEVRALAESLYARADWAWAVVRPPALCHGWSPEEGFLPYDWKGYNEAMLAYLLALGSPTHPIGPDSWDAWVSGYRWGAWYGREHLGFAPLFGHQYTHVWVDFRGIRDAYMRERRSDYFVNSRQAVYAQRDYAIDNPNEWTGYGALSWGLTASDGPVHRKLEIAGRERQFETYWARGASFTEVSDDGTLSPSAVAGSIAFAPEIVLSTLLAMRREHGERLFSTYGFLDAFNPTLTLDIPCQHGRVEPGVGWYDADYLGIDQGPIVAMIENYRSALVWGRMKRCPHLVRGLRAAGFTGGWLDAEKVEQ
jgi:hypothetical protein